MTFVDAGFAVDRTHLVGDNQEITMRHILGLSASRRAAALALAAATLGGSATSQAVTAIDRLKSLQGTSRPVVVLSDARDDPRVARQIAALDHAKPELDERNIQVLTEARPGSKLRKALGVAERGFAVVLVGKDGSVKKVWRDPVDPHRIFTIIDAMPMRRQEMRG